MLCVICKEEIPEERLEAMPEAVTCVRHADAFVPDVKGYMVFNHKTAPDIAIVRKSNPEAIRLAERAR